MTKKLRPDVASFLWKLTENEQVLSLLELSVGRVLEKAAATGAFPMSMIDAHQATHITDWLTSAVVADEGWLKATDTHGRPRKLMKFGSVEAIVAEADKAMAKFSKKNRTVVLREGAEELYAELDDGYHVVRLLTPEALDRESGEMQHCIGQGAYDHKVGSEHYDYLSFRDRFGKAHATIEVDLRYERGPIVLQCYGKQNEPPTKEYALMLAPMFREGGIRVGQLGGIVYDQHWVAHPVESMPDGIVVRGSMDIRHLRDLKLPPKMKVHGDFTCEGCTNIVMPRELWVQGNLHMFLGSVSEPADWVFAGQRAILTRMKTPEHGIASLLRARRLEADKMRTWTTIDEVEFDHAVLENCGFGMSELYEARGRTRAATNAVNGSRPPARKSP
ncbi:hypothetical protein HFO56_01440 [Rhizobium laguerreae]|uniref:PcfJ domain-containing protein n=1 Tax=Rhizobium laguerreae TaxID=1076926 RepID=UPI001C9138F5|nr:PcfJ domain-containing protein [Rhizobium laguerreae]MBY3151073.1 hypothetical protein [Rhizobium laguerreae]